MDKSEKRKELLISISDNPNAADKIFSQILDNKKNNIQELDIREPLYGNLNLAILMKKGFIQLEILRFSPGDITALTNIPQGIKTIIIADNLLEKIELPDSIEHIDLAHNLLKGSVDFGRNGLLKTIRVSYNHLSSLENLPENVEELYCDHNVLRELELKHMPKLRILYCDYNPKLVLKDLPDTLMESRLPDQRVQIESHQTNVNTKDYLYSLQTYFTMKAKYEKEVMNLKRQSKKTKRNIKTLPACNGCGLKVGMIFSGKDQKYMAYCGNTSKPCDWKIVIHRGDYYSFLDTLAEMKDNLEETKENMIRQKMDTLFQYISEQKSADLFKKQLSFFKTNSEMVDKYTEDYMRIYFSKEKKDIMDLKQKKIQEFLLEIQEHLAEGNLEEVVKIQHEKIHPIGKYIQAMQYPLMEMAYHVANNEWILQQKEMLLTDLEINHGEPISIEKTERKIEQKSKKDSVDMFFNKEPVGDIFQDSPAN